MKNFLWLVVVGVVIAGQSLFSWARQNPRSEAARETPASSRHVGSPPVGSVVLAQTSKPKTTYDFTGSWRGAYAYTLSNNKVTVDFTAVISMEGGWFSGRISEPNTFGDKTSDKLYANIRGALMEDGRVIFLKKYDGTAGVSHFVLYEAQLDQSRGTVRGKWSIRPDWWGTFEMTKQNP